jgi:hypothetical protein
METTAMRRPVLFSIACLIGLSTSSCAQAEKQRVYQWTDSQGVVHYSQIEPENVQSQSRDLSSSGQAQPAKAQAAAAPTQCDIAKANRDLLANGKAGDLIMDKDGDGKPDVMSEDDIKAAKELNEKQVRFRCKE